MKLKFASTATVVIVAIAIFSIGLAYQKSAVEQAQRETVSHQENTPAAELDQSEFDWGKIPRDKPVEKDFTLKNTGDATLQITRLATSCGCTTAELMRNETALKIPAEIPAGQSAQIHVVFDPAAHDSRGITKRAVRVETDDPENPFLIINLLADVQ